MVTVELFADVISPWHYIGKRRLESALRTLGGRVEVQVRRLPFELNPWMPVEGNDRRAYRTARVGNWERAVALDAQVAEAGRYEGLDFAFHRIERTPNTLDAHRLIALAGRLGAQDAVVEALFRAYFTEGRDLCQRSTLLDVVIGAGLDREPAARLLEGDDGKAEVRAEEARARTLGVGPVAHFILNRSYSVCAAWDASTLAAALERVEGRSSPPSSTRPPSRIQHGFPPTTCGCDFCRAYCKHVPGRLDASDLYRLCPPGEDVFAWAERHLRAVDDQPYAKLVPARQANGHCHWFRDGKCAVHEQAPYGCAFFDAHMPAAEVDKRSRASIQAAIDDAIVDGLHARVWRHLRDKGLTRPSGDRAPLDDEFRRIRQSMELG